jgi:nitrogen regulatory protein PII
MKQVQIVFNAAIEMELMTCLKQNGVHTYTKFPNIYGVGTHSEPHMGSHIWPGENHMLFIVTEDERVPDILACVRDLKKKKQREGIKAFVLPVEELV